LWVAHPTQSGQVLATVSKPALSSTVGPARIQRMIDAAIQSSKVSQSVTLADYMLDGRRALSGK